MRTRITADSRAHYVTKRKTLKCWSMNGKPDIATVDWNTTNIEPCLLEPEFPKMRLPNSSECTKACAAMLTRLRIMNTVRFGITPSWSLNRDLCASFIRVGIPQDLVSLFVTLTAQ